MNAHLRVLITLITAMLILCDLSNDAHAQTGVPAYTEELERGLEAQFSQAFFPNGKIKIMGPQESDLMERSGYDEEWIRLEFPQKYRASFEQAAHDGLIELEEQKVEGLDVLLTQGARFFTAAPTAKLLQLLEAGAPRRGFVKVPLGTMKVLEVISEEDYKPSRGVGGPGDQFKLILGRVNDIPSKQALQLGEYYSTIVQKELKFRAVLQVNPFTKTYAYVMADLGQLDRNDWMTNFVTLGRIPPHLRVQLKSREGDESKKGAPIDKSALTPQVRSAYNQAEILAKAFIQGKLKEVVGGLHSSLLPDAPSRDAVATFFETEFRNAEQSGIHFDDISLAKPSDVFTEGSNLFVTIPISFYFSSNLRRAKADSFVIGIGDSSQTEWKFILGHMLEELKQAGTLPKLPAQLPLPPITEPKLLDDQ